MNGEKDSAHLQNCFLFILTKTASKKISPKQTKHKNETDYISLFFASFLNCPWFLQETKARAANCSITEGYYSDGGQLR
jgi:hypothetical protein